MKMTVLGAALFIAAFFLAGVSGPSRAARPTGDTPATSYIADTDPATANPYTIGSDSFGAYRNGTDSVSSLVQGIGNWVLDTKPSPSRKVRIDLGDPVPGTGSTAPFLNALVPARFISKCTTDITTLAGGQTVLCPLAMSLTFGGTTYALRAAEPTAPGTDRVVWECVARSSTKCVSWTMRPGVVQPTGERKMKVALLRVATRPKDPDVPLGQFFMSFDIAVTTP